MATQTLRANSAFRNSANVLKDYRQHVYENLIVACSSVNVLVFTKTEYLLPHSIRTDGQTERHEEINSPFLQF